MYTDLLKVNQYTNLHIINIEMDVFTNLDGNYHVHILVDEQYENLIKMNFIMFTYGEIL